MTLETKVEFKTAILYVKKMCKNTEKIEMEKNSQSNALFYYIGN